MKNNLPGPKMIYIPGGTFRVGDDRGDIVTVEDFWMDETPVTVAQYLEAVKAGACNEPYIRKYPENNCLVAGRENHPANCVSWYEALAYARWAGKRLPTLSEWQWAAIGRDENREYPWGNELPSNQLNWSGHGDELGYGMRKSTSPVGLHPKGDSRDGLKDMVGSVYEWVEWVDRKGHGADDSEFKSVCGGSWRQGHRSNVRSRTIFSMYKKDRHSGVGFRCVCVKCVHG